MFRIWNKYWKKTTLSICCFWLWMCACRVILLQFCISTRLHQYIEKKWIYSIDYKQQVDERDFIFLINKFRFFTTKWNFYLELIYFTWIYVIHSGKKKNVERKVFTRALAIINHDDYVFGEILHTLWSSVDFVWNVLFVEFI